jgi:seryl-tRNA synthetase
MEIIRIFDTVKQGLYAIKYNNQAVDEFTRLIELWQDLVYLEEFFNTNKNNLQSGYFGTISVESAIMLTLKDSQALEKQLLEINDSEENESKSLNNIFKPLNNITYKPGDFQKSKAYGVLEKTWLRLYALKVDDNYFVIAGGAIKLTQKMAQNTHTQNELKKLDQCRDYLREEGIFDADGLNQN